MGHLCESIRKLGGEGWPGGLTLAGEPCIGHAAGQAVLEHCNLHLEHCEKALRQLQVCNSHLKTCVHMLARCHVGAIGRHATKIQKPPPPAIFWDVEPVWCIQEGDATQTCCTCAETHAGTTMQGSC